MSTALAVPGAVRHSRASLVPLELRTLGLRVRTAAAALRHRIAGVAALPGLRSRSAPERATGAARTDARRRVDHADLLARQGLDAVEISRRTGVARDAVALLVLRATAEREELSARAERAERAARLEAEVRAARAAIPAAPGLAVAP